jgi:Lamin Tail Domain
LSNNNERLYLYDASDNIIDSANANGGAWPAGNASDYSSMQRSVLTADSNFVWVTYDINRDTPANYAYDANGNNIRGTPGRGNLPVNVTTTPTATPRNTPRPANTPVPLQPVIGISEFLPRPGTDWNEDGVVDVFDEFIEIINAGRIDINLGAYRLDDEQGQGSPTFILPSITLKPDERAVFFASETGILLSDAGDSVRLLRGATVVDAYTYGVVRYPDQSWCRIPDRLGYWNDPCFPTPNTDNALTGTVPSPAVPITGYSPRVCLLPDTTPDVFVYGECEAGGDEIWNRKFWDGPGESKPLILEEDQKWVTFFE